MKEHKLSKSKEKIAIPSLTYYYSSSSSKMNPEKFLTDILVPLLEEAGIECDTTTDCMSDRFHVDGVLLEVFCRDGYSESYRIQNNLGQPYSGDTVNEKHNQYYIRGEKEIKKKVIIDNILRLVAQQKVHDNEVLVSNFIRSFLKDGKEKIEFVAKELFGQDTYVNARKYHGSKGTGCIEVYPYGEYTTTRIEFNIDGSLSVLKIEESIKEKQKLKKFIMGTLNWLSKIDELGKRIKEIYKTQFESFVFENKKAREIIYEHLNGEK